jgi:hypothetical protein
VKNDITCFRELGLPAHSLEPIGKLSSSFYNTMLSVAITKI